MTSSGGVDRVRPGGEMWSLEQEAKPEVVSGRSQAKPSTVRSSRLRRWPPSSVCLLLGLCFGLLASVGAQTENSTSATVDSDTSSAVSLEPTPSSKPIEQTHKLKPVNFTLVDELFHSTVNESELLRRWKNMDGQFQEGIRSILKLVFPQIVAISQDAKVSGDCSGGILKWILSLRNLRSWAIKMLDATGKPTAGIFEGSLTMFGNHRQCLGIRAPDEDEIEITEQFEEYFRGQFCVLHLRPWLAQKRPFYHLNTSVEPLLRKGYKYYEKTLYDELAEIAVAFNFIDIRMDLCVPSTCTTADIQRVADLLSRKLEMRAKVMRCDIESRDPASTFVQNLDSTTKIWLAGPICLVLITLISTLLVMFGCSRETGDPLGDNLTERSSRFGRLLYCASLQGALRNLSDCCRDEANDEDERDHIKGLDTNAKLLKCRLLKKPMPLYGLRNLFVIWFVIVQLTVELKYQYLRESLVLRDMMLNYWPFQIIINTSMIFESLILITAFTYGYCNLDTNVASLLGYIATKCVRLVPSIATVVMISIVLPSIGIASPVWRNFVEEQSSVCKSTGYLNLMFLQNFVAYDKICLPHSWLFCVEMQLIALAIPVVLLLQRNFKRTSERNPSPMSADCLKGRSEMLQETQSDLLLSRAGLVGLMLVLVGAGGNFAQVYINKLPPAWFHTFPDAAQKEFYFTGYLTKAWAHLSSFVIGLYAGHLAKRRLIAQLSQMDPQFSSSSNSLGQSSQESRECKGEVSFAGSACRLIALSCLGALLFLTYSWSTWELPSPLVSGLYDCASRVVWSVALTCLMLQLCAPARDGAYSRLSWLFSTPVCIVLGRLSFLAYLIAPLVHTFVLAVQEQSLFPSLYMIFHVILGNIVIIYSIAFVLSLMIEQPIRLVVDCVSRRAASRSRGSARISTANATTTTSVTSLANESAR